MRNAQENLRLSTNQNQRIIQELNEYKSRIQTNDEENSLLKGKIQKLIAENSNLGQYSRYKRISSAISIKS